MTSPPVLYSSASTHPLTPLHCARQYCWALYNTYLKCVDKSGVLDDRCQFLHKSTIAICPTEWVTPSAFTSPPPLTTPLRSSLSPLFTPS